MKATTTKKVTKKPATKMLVKKVNAKVKKDGITKVTNELGYRSTNTVRSWIKKNEIPVQAIDKVKTFLTPKKPVTL